MEFSKVSENQISAAIVNGFYEDFQEMLKSDVIIIGAGPSGLIAAADLAKEGYNVLVVESNNYLGGGFWIGGFLMNRLTFRAPGELLLKEIGIPYRKISAELAVASGPQACSKLIAHACDCGVKFLNMAKFDDVILRHDRVEGVVINWTPVSALPRAITCVDPISLEAKAVIDATGHDAWVCKSLEKRDLLKMRTFGPMDVNSSEDLVVEKTGKVYPGLFVCGMSAATVFGVPRMGPTFSGMLFSGKKAAAEVKEFFLNQAKEDSCKAEALAAR